MTYLNRHAIPKRTQGWKMITWRDFQITCQRGEGEMVGWRHRRNGHEIEQTLRDGEGQGGLECCSPWDHKETDTTEWLNDNHTKWDTSTHLLGRMKLTTLATPGSRATVASVPSHFSHVWVHAPGDCSPLGSSVHGIPQARILQWVAIPPPGGSSRPRDQTCVSYVSCTGRQILYH